MRNPIRTITPVLLAGSLLGAPLLAHAEITANVALTTDYVWRGTSQTLEDPAIQGGFDYAHASGLYVGVWGSNVDFGEGDSADLEFDVYGGFGGEFGGGIGYDIGLIYYAYPGTAPGVDYDWLEVYGSLSYSYFTLALNYSSDVFNSGEDGLYINLSGEYPINDTFSISGGIGNYSFDDSVFGPGAPDSYSDWNVGLSAAYAGLGFDLRYHDTDDDGETLFGDIADGRVVFTVSKEL
jgi:uncharacterized protein (TIGR02001 family)